MIFLSKTTAETGGTIVLRRTAAVDKYENTARLARVKTLDGGAAFTHSGVTDKDRDYAIRGRLDENEALKVREFFEASQPLRIGGPAGAFIGYIYNLSIGRGLTMTATLYLSENLTN